MKKKNTLVIAIGSDAQNVADILYQKDKNFSFLCFDNEKQVINTANTKTIWFNNLKFQKTEFDFEHYKNVLLNRTSKFREEISNYKNITLVSFIGNKFSSETLFEVIKYFKDFDVNHNIFAINPSNLDGKKAKNLAIKSLGKLTNLRYSLGKDLFLFDSNEVMKENPKSIEENLNLVYTKASEIVSMILELDN